MQALQNFLMKYLMPIANKLEKQKHLQSIKDGMIGNIPIIVVGSICLLPTAFMNLLGSGSVYDALNAVNPFFSVIAKYTNDLVSIYAAYLIAKQLAKRYDIDNSSVGVCAIAVHLILTGFDVEGGIGISYLGASGLFVGIISGILSVEVTRLLRKHNIIIRLPESVPAMVGESFSSLIPLIVNVALASIIATGCTQLSGVVFPQFVMNLLAPAISTMDSLWVLLIVIFLTQLLWFFGLHGPSITSAVWSPFAIAYGAENIAAYAAGEPVQHIFTFGLYYNVLQVCGSGLTLGLVLFMIRSKCRSYNAIGKAAIVPSLFGINEPVIFGAPIILNPFMFIPFVFGPLLVTVITWFAFDLGLVGMPIANPPGFMPPGVGAFLMTLDWRSVVLVLLLLALMAVIYYPFFKTMEKDELKKEQEKEQKAEA